MPILEVSISPIFKNMNIRRFNGNDVKVRVIKIKADTCIKSPRTRETRVQNSTEE